MSKGRRWVTLTAALAVGAVSTVVGMAPNIVEDAHAHPVDCGPALFHGSTRPSPLCDATVDSWRLVAEMGLLVSACLLVVTIAFLVRSAVGRRAETGRRGPAQSSRL